jgi:hypothetical protein
MMYLYSALFNLSNSIESKHWRNIMSMKQLVTAAFALAVASLAQADQSAEGPTAAAKSRAQVLEELRQAQADGSAKTYGFLGLFNPAAKATQPGQAVKPEVKEASAQSEKSRADVRAELILAQGRIKADRGQRGSM